jgi:hypothetical protein
MSAVRSLTGQDRTWCRQPNSVEIDPDRTFGSLGGPSLKTADAYFELDFATGGADGILTNKNTFGP